jgi:hypothetical protein
MAHDRADWHYGGDYPKDLPPEAGGTHIGMYLAWAISRGLEGEFHRENSADALAAVRNREITGREFLTTMCDEKFWEEDLGDIGNAFTRDYYSSKTPPSYYDDYGECLGGGLPSLYHVEDTWENFDKVAAVLDRRFADWQKRRSR